MSGRSSTGAGGWATAGSSPLCPSGTCSSKGRMTARTGLQAFQGSCIQSWPASMSPHLKSVTGPYFGGVVMTWGMGRCVVCPAGEGCVAASARRVVVRSGREADSGAADAHHGLGPYLEEPVGDLQVGGREVLHGRPSAAAIGVPGQFVEERIDAPVQGVLLPGHTCRDPVQDGRGHVDRSALGGLWSGHQAAPQPRSTARCAAA